MKDSKPDSTESQPGNVLLNDSPPPLATEAASDLIGGMSEPSNEAIEADANKKAAKQAEWSHVKDRFGNVFDPAIHRTRPGSDEPAIDKRTGRCQLKPGMASKMNGKPTVKSEVGGKSESGKSIPKPSDLAMAQQTGVALAHMFFTTGQLIGGEEWAPRADKQTGLNETEMMESAFVQYCQAKEYTDIPPGLALTFAMCAYALPRFSMPKTQTRVKTMKEKIGIWWYNRKHKKQAIRAKAQAAQKAAEKKDNEKDDRPL